MISVEEKNNMESWDKIENSYKHYPSEVTSFIKKLRELGFDKTTNTYTSHMALILRGESAQLDIAISFNIICNYYEEKNWLNEKIERINKKKVKKNSLEERKEMYLKRLAEIELMKNKIEIELYEKQNTPPKVFQPSIFEIEKIEQLLRQIEKGQL